MPRKARHAVSCDTYAPTALLKCFSSILIRYQYKTDAGKSPRPFYYRFALIFSIMSAYAASLSVVLPGFISNTPPHS